MTFLDLSPMSPISLPAPQEVPGSCLSILQLRRRWMQRDPFTWYVNPRTHLDTHRRPSCRWGPAPSSSSMRISCLSMHAFLYIFFPGSVVERCENVHIYIYYDTLVWRAYTPCSYVGQTVITMIRFLQRPTKSILISIFYQTHLPASRWDHHHAARGIGWQGLKKHLYRPWLMTRSAASASAIEPSEETGSSRSSQQLPGKNLPSVRLRLPGMGWVGYPSAPWGG